MESKVRAWFAPWAEDNNPVFREAVQSMLQPVCQGELAILSALQHKLIGVQSHLAHVLPDSQEQECPPWLAQCRTLAAGP